jgi:uncharacterized membrane protein HdeD (DUF308 family)
MIRLALLLLGPDFIRARWRVLAVIGVLWAALGVAIFIDALDGDVWFPVHVFGYLLILEALVTLVATTSHLGTQTVLRKSRGAVFLILGTLMIDPRRSAEFILALLFGVLVGVDGVLRVSAAWVVRFPGWRASLLMGVLELIFAAFMIEPYPTFYAGTVPYCVGMAFFLSGLGTLLLARVPELAGQSGTVGGRAAAPARGVDGLDTGIGAGLRARTARRHQSAASRTRHPEHAQHEPRARRVRAARVRGAGAGARRRPQQQRGGSQVPREELRIP